MNSLKLSHKMGFYTNIAIINDVLNDIGGIKSLKPFRRVILVWQTFLRKSQAIVGCLNGRQTMGIIRTFYTSEIRHITFVDENH